MIHAGHTPPVPGTYRHPWRKVKSAERSTAWWDNLTARVTWFIETECGHFMYRAGKNMKAPKRVRCKGCMPELEPDTAPETR